MVTVLHAEQSEPIALVVTEQKGSEVLFRVAGDKGISPVYRIKGNAAGNPYSLYGKHVKEWLGLMNKYAVQIVVSAVTSGNLDPAPKIIGPSEPNKNA
jgi:hypothetical protein